MYATDGTFESLKGAGFGVRRVSEITGSSPHISGRVKTLDQRLFTSILAIRNNREHMKEMEYLDIPPIDLIVSNLYPFERAASDMRRPEDEVLESIDIGGVSLIRAAAKNFENVAVLTSVAQYPRFIEEMRRGNGSLSIGYLKELATEAFRRTATYDASIYSYFKGRENVPSLLVLQKDEDIRLKYGENPSQVASAYRRVPPERVSLFDARVYDGKELSFNNLLDLHAAVQLSSEFENPCAVIVKHTNPSSAATGQNAAEALSRAYEGDPVSAYGCVIGVNKEVDRDCVTILGGKFVDCIVAPSYTEDALVELRRRKKMRVVEWPEMSGGKSSLLDIRAVRGGYLIQDWHIPAPSSDEIRCVTERKPDRKEEEDMLFAWKVVRYLWSNAIVVAKEGMTVGIGAGQSSRVDAVRIAVTKSEGRSRGAVLASDAFFPFRDGIDEAAAGGIEAIIQPGGSMRDGEVIAAANEHGIAMLITGQRLFRH